MSTEFSMDGKTNEEIDKEVMGLLTEFPPILKLADVLMHPEKYGYVQCPHCFGYGSSLNEESERCTYCIDSPVKGLVTKAKAQSYTHPRRTA